MQIEGVALHRPVVVPSGLVKEGLDPIVVRRFVGEL